MSYIKREEVLGKLAIAPDGNAFGTVKDLAFSTKGDVGLVLAKKDGTESTVSIRQVAAIGEFVLLSSAMVEAQAPPAAVVQAPPAPSPKPSTCPSCGSPLRQGAKFCGKCGHKLV